MFLGFIFSASTKFILTFALFLIPACSSASLIDLYESFNSVYFPTKDTLISFSGTNFALTTLFQSFKFGFFVLILSFSKIILSTFCLFNNNGIEYTVSTSCIEITLELGTEQNKAIFFLSSEGSSCSDLQIRRSGPIPKDLSSLTEC